MDNHGIQNYKGDFIRLDITSSTLLQALQDDTVIEELGISDKERKQILKKTDFEDFVDFESIENSDEKQDIDLENLKHDLLVDELTLFSSEKLELLETIGRGVSAIVYKAVLEENVFDVMNVAVKVS